MPAGFAPFNVQNLGGTLFVTYAVVGDDGDDEPGLGNGLVDAFDLQGNLLGRVGTYRGKGMNGILTAHGDTATAQRVGRTRLEFQLDPPAAPLTVMMPIVVIPRDTLR